MKAILLCAGYATRLYPLTENQPKALLPVADQPILDYILSELLKIKSLSEVIVVTNHKFAPHLSQWASEKSKTSPCPVSCVDDMTSSNETRLGAIGDLHYVLKQKKIGAEDILVVAGDNLFDFDLIKFVREAEQKRPQAVIAVYDIKDIVLARQYGLVRLDGQDKVLEFLEKPQNPPTTLASCGLYWLPAQTRDLLDRYIREGHNADQPGHYMRWLSETNGLYAVSLQGSWYDIGDLKSYQKADAHFREILNNPKGK